MTSQSNETKSSSSDFLSVNTVHAAERRWLVDLAAVGPLDQLLCHEIQDVYVPGTLLRLRGIRDGRGNDAFWICKKHNAGGGIANPELTCSLTEDEYEAFVSRLSARIANKVRYALERGALHVYKDAANLAIFEMTFASTEDAQQFTAPAFAIKEVTEVASYGDDQLAISDLKLHEAEVDRQAAQRLPKAPAK